MDVLLASRAVQWFREGYEKQVRKEEEEAEDIVNGIDLTALKTLCRRYDNKIGEYPEHAYEGEAVFEFFKKLKVDVEKRSIGAQEIKKIDTSEVKQ